MSNPLLYAGAITAGYLAGRGRSGRRALHPKNEVWSDGRLVYYGTDHREARKAYRSQGETYNVYLIWLSQGASLDAGGYFPVQRAAGSPLEGLLKKHPSGEGFVYAPTRRSMHGSPEQQRAVWEQAARGRRAASGSSTPRTYKQLNKWLLDNGYGYEIVTMRMTDMPAYYGGWHRYVDAVEGHPQPFGNPDSDFWYSSSVYALSPSVKTYDEWVEAIRDLSKGEGGNIWWGS